MNNNYQYNNKTCSILNKQCNVNNPKGIVDLVVNCITNNCEIDNLDDTQFIYNAFRQFEIDPNIKNEIINKINNNNENIREITSPLELDDISQLCYGDIRVRGPAAYFLYNSNSNKSIKLIRITSGTPYIRLWKID